LEAELLGQPLSASALERVVDARTAADVPAGTVLIHPAASWDDLVLPADRLLQLEEAVARARHQAQVLDDWGFGVHRGERGLRMLFCGPPGTGKTLAAEIVAGALGRDLLIVDISRMVSKWIGETEKNLAAAFDAAERGGAALFFDEADALFGRRTEVADARDRYANLETAYLLSRLERFEGVAVLATNLRQNLDLAFARRLECIVAFDPPDVAEREVLWHRHLPPSAPLDTNVDLGRLAALYDLSGALIRNAATAAAFLAAADGGDGPACIGLRHLVRAIRREYAKAGQSFPGAPQGVPA
jgi:SpoVK/Ycf46/Vps4 family AAA+-type ATPase